MRFVHRTAVLIATASAGLSLVATATATAAPASFTRKTAHPPKGCINHTATIPVGTSPGGFPIDGGVAVNPKTNTIYVTKPPARTASDNMVSVINGRTNSVTTTIHLLDFLQGIAANPKTKTAYAVGTGRNKVYVLARCPK